MAMASMSVSCTSSTLPVAGTLPCGSCSLDTAQQSVAKTCMHRRAPAGFANPKLMQRQSCNKKRAVVGGHFEKQSPLSWRVDAGLKETALTEEKWGPPITLGTARLPQDVNLGKLENLLFQWGSNLTQNANLPLPVPLKVDRIEGGVRLGYIRVTDGTVEDIVHIDAIVTPASDEQPKAMFRAIRNGQLKGSVPPGEPLIMQSLLAALKISIPLARPSA